MNPFAEWQNFYVVVGSAAGALTGLQFVAMALIAEISMGPEETGAGEAFSTPTIVHFGTVLMLSAVLEIPWRGVNGGGGSLRLNRTAGDRLHAQDCPEGARAAGIPASDGGLDLPHCAAAVCLPAVGCCSEHVSAGH